MSKIIKKCQFCKQKYNKYTIAPNSRLICMNECGEAYNAGLADKNNTKPSTQYKQLYLQNAFFYGQIVAKEN